ncbi:MAG: DNA-binding protein [Synergistales bacterium]|nr:DNA-binding protein [Synergistales bacterium]
MNLLSDIPSLDKRINLTLLYDLYAPALTNRQREVFELHEIMDLSLGEISEKIGVSRQASHDFLNRAIERLRSLDQELSFSVRIRDYEQRFEDLQLQVDDYREQLPEAFLAQMDRILNFRGEQNV